MHTYRPPRQNRCATVIPILLLLFCVCCIAASEISPLIPPYLLQFIGFAMVAVAIQIINRYSLTWFVYETDSEKGLFNITKVLGKKNTLAASIEFSDILYLDKKEKGYSPKKKYNKPFRVYNFCNNMYPLNAYYLICNVEGEDIAVIVEADEHFLELIKENLSNNKGENQ